MCVVCTLSGGESVGIECNSGSNSGEFNGVSKPYGLHRHDMV